MQRREFITLLGGAAAAWPLAVRAEQADQLRRIGVLKNDAAATAAIDIEIRSRQALVVGIPDPQERIQYGN